MKVFIYLLFYFISVLSIIISCIGSYFLMILFMIPVLPFLSSLQERIQVIKDFGVGGVLLLGIPFFIFIFQIAQDFNYQIIHKLGFWAKPGSRFRYKGFSYPDFYQLSLHDQNLQERSKKAKYRFRLLSISIWSVATLVAEIFLVCFVVIANQYNIHIHPIIGFILMLPVGWLFFYLWERLKNQLHLEIVYVENEREFLCKSSIKEMDSKFYTSNKIIKK